MDGRQVQEMGHITVTEIYARGGRGGMVRVG